METEKKPEGWSRKIYLELTPPSQEDNVSDQERILRALRGEYGEVSCSLPVLKKLYPLCCQADWKITLLLVWNGKSWELADIEPGDTSDEHYGFCADLGSTTLAGELVDMNTGKVLWQKSVFNHQIAYGEDILTRIFYGKDNPQKLEEIRKATVDSFLELFEKMEQDTGISGEQCASMVIAGNTTMMHFLYGLDAFCVFSAPYAVRTLKPDCYRAVDLGFPLKGYVYGYPGQANYLGGDILSGIVETEIYKGEEISVFLDIGTNGELVIGAIQLGQVEITVQIERRELDIGTIHIAQFREEFNSLQVLDVLAGNIKESRARLGVAGMPVYTLRKGSFWEQSPAATALL